MLATVPKAGTVEETDVHERHRAAGQPTNTRTT